MHSLTSAFLTRFQFSATDASTLRRLGEFRGRQKLYTRQRPEALEDLRTVAAVESTESSNRIEGVVAPASRIKAIVLRDTTPRGRSEQEIAGYRDALSLVHESARDMPFSASVVLQLHRMLYRYLPQDGGRWKMTDNEIVERDRHGNVVRVRFRPVPAVATPHAMDELASRYLAAVDAEELDPLVIVPLSILDFLCIHPFTDGNGRVGRLLTLQLLYHFDYEVGRYISLERIVEESRDAYYDALQASSNDWHQERHDAFPWLRYFWGVLLRAYDEFEERIGTVSTGRGAKSEHVRAVIARKVAPFTISELERDCPGVSRDTIRLVLRKLRDEGRIAVEGWGRGARWVLKQHD